MSRGIVVRDGTNTPRSITEIQVRDGTNTARDISEIWVRDSNNVPRLVFSTAPEMTASASPETVYGYSPGSGTATTDATTITPVGGTPPYTYGWTLGLYDGPGPPSVNSPTSATTDFTQTGIPPGGSVSADWTWSVTDSSVPPANVQGTVNSFWNNAI